MPLMCGQVKANAIYYNIYILIIYSDANTCSGVEVSDLIAARHSGPLTRMQRFKPCWCTFLFRFFIDFLLMTLTNIPHSMLFMLSNCWNIYRIYRIFSDFILSCLLLLVVVADILYSWNFCPTRTQFRAYSLYSLTLNCSNSLACLSSQIPHFWGFIPFMMSLMGVRYLCYGFLSLQILHTKITINREEDQYGTDSSSMWWLTSTVRLP